MNRVNPLALASIGVTSLIASFAIRSLDVALVVFGVYVVLAIVFVRRWRYLVLTLFFAGLAAAAVAYSTWRLGGRDLEIAFTAALRIMILAWPGSLVAGLIDPMRLGDYLAQSLRLSSHMVVAATSAAQQVGSLNRSWETIAHTRRARGLGPHGWFRIHYAAGVVFALFVSAMRQATGQAIALDARGFSQVKQRSWAEPAPWKARDFVVIALGCAIAALPWLALATGV